MDERIGSLGVSGRVDMLQQMVNSIVDFPPGQQEVGKNWTVISIPNELLIII